jgi:hypothetical protein
MFIIEYKESLIMLHLKMKSKFFVQFASRYSHKWTSICEKMAQNVTRGSLWGDFTIILYIDKYLQRPIYIWNRISKHIMSQCGMNFQTIPLYITCSSQHFEQLDYFNGAPRSLHVFRINDPKVIINLDEFPSFLESTKQQPLIQFSHQL